MINLNIDNTKGFNGRSDGDRIGSTAIVAIFGGLASEATGGDFAEGALRAAFVHLFNDLGSMIITEDGKLTSATGLEPKLDTTIEELLDTDIFDVGAMGQFHLLLFGVHYHKSFKQEQLCLRVGPGLQISGGAEAIMQTQLGQDSMNADDAYNPENLQLGLGLDIATGSDFGGSILFSDDKTMEISGGLRGYGLGASIGVDICYQF